MLRPPPRHSQASPSGAWRAGLRPLLEAALVSLFWGLLTLGAAAGIWRAWHAELLAMRELRLEGELRYLAPESLRTAAQAGLRGNFFQVDLDAIAESVASLAWVEQVWVERVWPGTLRLRVEEQVPVARWGSDAVLSARSRIFYPPRETIPQGLPQLEGPEHSQEAVLHAYRRIAQVLAPLELKPLRLSLSPRRDWVLEIDSGVKVRLGRGDFGARLARFTRVLPHLARGEGEAIETVDLRYTNGLSVLWKGTHGS